MMPDLHGLDNHVLHPLARHLGHWPSFDELMALADSDLRGIRGLGAVGIRNLREAKAAYMATTPAVNVKDIVQATVFESVQAKAVDGLLRLNLGSGNRRQREGYVTLDANPAVHPDLIARIPPIPLPDESCAAVFSSHLLEHFPDDQAFAVLAEAWRVLVVDGCFEVVVPYALSHGAFQDPTHRSYWVPEKFCYACKHFEYLGYGYESRFLIDELEYDENEVRAVLRKIPEQVERCLCSFCTGITHREGVTNGTS